MNRTAALGLARILWLVQASGIMRGASISWRTYPKTHEEYKAATNTMGFQSLYLDDPMASGFACGHRSPVRRLVCTRPVGHEEKDHAALDEGGFPRWLWPVEPTDVDPFGLEWQV